MLSSNLIAARKMAGLSLRELAEAIGGVISRQGLHRYEKGEVVPDDDMLTLLAKALDTTVPRLKGTDTATALIFPPLRPHTYGNCRYWGT